MWVAVLRVTSKKSDDLETTTDGDEEEVSDTRWLSQQIKVSTDTTMDSSIGFRNNNG